MSGKSPHVETIQFSISVITTKQAAYLHSVPSHADDVDGCSCGSLRGLQICNRDVPQQRITGHSLFIDQGLLHEHT